ncbi:MAG TPA: efflux transporter outer membrane subunit [Candidatus Angelobacter sp.]
MARIISNRSGKIWLSSMVLWLASCTVGPNYKRPVVAAPEAYRGATDQPAGNAAQGNVVQNLNKDKSASLSDEKWSEVFPDKELQELIRTALRQNYDLRIAATRILEAQAQLGITRADQYPSVSVGGGITNQQSAASGPIPSFEQTKGQVSASASWQLDFWGRYRRATEAARANLLASEWARRQVITTLIANVAAAYFQLREFDLELEISRRTVGSRTGSLQLTRTLQEHGANSMLDVRQAEQLVYTASEQVPDLERRIAQQEDALSILLGNNPGDIPRGLKLTEQPHAPEVPAGLPSALLERRPDIRQAEQQLIAANAEIGVARAAFFPQISLTGSAGYQSSALTSLFTGPSGFWSMAGALAQPIFQGGRIRSNLRLTQAQQQEAVLFYQKTVQGAFRDVSDALIGYRKNREFREQQDLLTQAAQDAARLSEIRYRAGESSYIEVLTNETNYFTAELGLAQAQGNELIALVQLYQALGGGWEQ